MEGLINLGMDAALQNGPDVGVRALGPAALVGHECVRVDIANGHAIHTGPPGAVAHVRRRRGRLVRGRGRRCGRLVRGRDRVLVRRRRLQSLLPSCTLLCRRGLRVLVDVAEGRHQVYFLPLDELADLLFASEVVDA